MNNYHDFEHVPPQLKVELATELTRLCWDKCVIHKSSHTLGRSEKNCLDNCTVRYLDAYTLAARRIDVALGSNAGNVTH